MKIRVRMCMCVPVVSNVILCPFSTNISDARRTYVTHLPLNTNHLLRFRIVRSTTTAITNGTTSHTTTTSNGDNIKTSWCVKNHSSSTTMQAWIFLEFIKYKMKTPTPKQIIPNRWIPVMGNIVYRGYPTEQTS